MQERDAKKWGGAEGPEYSVRLLRAHMVGTPARISDIPLWLNVSIAVQAQHVLIFIVKTLQDPNKRICQCANTQSI